MSDYSCEQYLKSMFVLEANGKHSYSTHSITNIIEHFLVNAEEFNQIDLTKYTNKLEFNTPKIKMAFNKKFKLYENCFESLYWMKYLAPHRIENEQQERFTPELNKILADYLTQYIDYSPMKKLPLCFYILAKNTDKLEVELLRKYRNRLLSSEILNMHSLLHVLRSLNAVTQYKFKAVSIDR